MYFHYDTETDGLNVEGVPSNDPRQPHLVSITAILDDADGNELDRYFTYIKPVGWKIDERLEIENPKKPGTMMKTAFAIHGITNQKATDEGVPLDEAMGPIVALAARAEILSAFNHFFDFKMLKISCAQMSNPDTGATIRAMLEAKSAICTMDSARKHLGAGRWIKLTDAHQRLLGSAFDGAHGSTADCEAHRRIFYHLEDLGALHEPKPTLKVYDTPYQKVSPAPADASVATNPLADVVMPVRKKPAAL